MTKIDYKREDIERIYDEVDRRIEMEIKDGGFKYISEVVEYRKAMLQGVYSTLMVTAKDWPQVVFWTDQIEERYHADLVAAGCIKA